MVTTYKDFRVTSRSLLAVGQPAVYVKQLASFPLQVTCSIMACVTGTI